MVVAIDTGRSTTKVCTKDGYFHFPSALGEWIDRTGNKETVYGDFDLEIEHEGKRYFGGTLAQYESDWDTTMHTETKNNIENLILVLTALHLTCDKSRVKVITGQPIKVHTDENKKLIKEMIAGKNTIILNGTKKEFYIEDVAVSCEGGVSAYSLQYLPRILRILDFGSATVNGATLIDGKYVKNQSKTLPFGLETTEEINEERMASKIISEYSRKWRANDDVVLVGGGGEKFLPYIKDYFKKSVLHTEPLYANAIGMYKVGVSIWQ